MSEGRFLAIYTRYSQSNPSFIHLHTDDNGLRMQVHKNRLMNDMQVNMMYGNEGILYCIVHE
jgi:hypothetical protein